MIDKKDARWWILEAQQHPESAADLVQLLAERLAYLDRQNEELRGDLIALRRKPRGEAGAAEIGALQTRIAELESALRQSGTERRALAYGTDGAGRIEINQPLSASGGAGAAQNSERDLAGEVALLLCGATSRLLVVTADSRAFNVSLADLPVPTPQGAAALGSPPGIVAMLDQAVFETCRYLTLVSQNGYAYSLLVGAISRAAARQEKLIRNLIPGDPIRFVIPSNNADLFAVSRRGRWTRFPEKAIAGSGSAVMELPKGDALAGLTWLGADTDLIFLTESGRLFVRASADLPARKTPGHSAGVLVRDQVMRGVVTGRDVVILTRRGQLLSVPLSNPALRYRAQSEEGLPIPGLAADDGTVAFAAG